MNPLSQDQALHILWVAHIGEPVRFLYATLTEPIRMHIGRDREAPEGTTVLVTMFSRFGDVGIRDDNLVPASDGYYARVRPEKLKDWRFAP